MSWKVCSCKYKKCLKSSELSIPFIKELNDVMSCKSVKERLWCRCLFQDFDMHHWYCNTLKMLSRSKASIYVLMSQIMHTWLSAAIWMLHCWLLMPWYCDKIVDVNFLTVVFLSYSYVLLLIVLKFFPQFFIVLHNEAFA